MKAGSSDPGVYVVDDRRAIIDRALALLDEDMRTGDVFMTSPGAVRDYLRLHVANRADQNVEVFTVLFLDNNHRLLALEDMFTGTLTQTSVYPREVVRAALRNNAAAVVLAHNHPSGTVEPSRADEALTQNLKAALALVDVRVLDHIVVGQGKALSMAEKGLI